MLILAFGISRWEPEGSRGLQLASSQAGAHKTRGKRLPVSTVKKMSATCRARGPVMASTGKPPHLRPCRTGALYRNCLLKPFGENSVQIPYQAGEFRIRAFAMKPDKIHPSD